MGSFHCPIGAATRGAAGCVQCGLCTAITHEEQVAAANLMRSHIRGQASERVGVMRKIAVCGKGGVGKSTIVSLLARALVHFGYRVLVIDTDESNPSMHQFLGISQAPQPLITMLERFAPDAGPEEKGWLGADAILVKDIPAQFITRNGNLSMLCVGKIEDPLIGCACPMGALARELMMNLEPVEGEVVIVDLEAGVESFGRGMEQGVDTILAIVEPSRNSVLLADKIRYMAEGLGIQRIRAILNKMPDVRAERRIRDMLIEHEVRFIGNLPYGDDIAEASFDGIAPMTGPSVEQMRVLATLLLDEADMDHPITIHTTGRN